MESFGIALSGADSGNKLRQELENRLAGLLFKVFARNNSDDTNLQVISDIWGSVYAATHNSAIVLIAGTGSNCIFVNQRHQ